MVYSKTIMFISDTDIDYKVSREYGDGEDLYNIVANGEEVLSLTREEAKDMAKALSELANGY